MGEDNRTTKYLIKASITTDGVIERPDVVGAIFGQTEGILDKDLDLRELQKNGGIGRINVNVKSEKGKSKGAISIPSSLDKNKTAMIGAALETIDRVGPCEAEIEIDQIQDTKEAKRQFIQDRAKELVEEIGGEEESPPEKRKSSSQARNVEKYKGLPAGPTAAKSDAIIIVEGRSDVINLLEHGIRNTVAIEGTNVPPVVSEISKNKTTTVFLDGDRGGDLILKEILQVADLDYVARAPQGQNVEDLSADEVRKALKEKEPAEGIIASIQQEEAEGEDELQELVQTLSGLKATSMARLLDENMEVLKETKVRKLAEELENTGDVKYVLFDGVITQNIADLASEKGIKYLIGMRERLKSKPDNTEVLTLKEIQ